MPGHQCRFAVRALATSPDVLFLEASVGRITLDGLSPASERTPKGVGDGQTVDIPLPLVDDSVPGVCGVS